MRQYAKQSVFVRQSEDLGDSLDVGVDVEVRELDPFRLAGATAREDHRHDVIHGNAPAAEGPL